MDGTLDSLMCEWIICNRDYLVCTYGFRQMCWNCVYSGKSVNLGQYVCFIRPMDKSRSPYFTCVKWIKIKIPG
jgi:hypothetical protein